MTRFLPHAAVFAAAFGILSWGAGTPGLATAWVDPVAKIQAQDESVYAASSLAMARGEGWGTPMFMGRYALYKPPLLYWLSAASVRIFGETPWALRLPSLFAGAGIVTLVFAWVLLEAGSASALAAALLTISTHLVFTLSRIAITDALLSLFALGSAFTLYLDPRLGRLWPVFGVACGAAILTKSVAGLIAPIAALAYWLLLRQTPSMRSLLLAAALASAIALPWHLYQYWIHPQWFWAEYVQSELLGWGLAPPSQTTPEPASWFYGKRLAMLDPFLLGAALVAVWRRRSLGALALSLAVLAAAFAYQYRNAAYLLPLFPALAILAGVGLPARSLLAGASAVAVLKVLAVPATWAVPFAPEFINGSYAELAQHRRSHPLIIADPPDQFFAATLPGVRLRYALRGEPGSGPRPPLDFEHLGIALTLVEFENLDALLPRYRQRLREFGLDSTAPVGTVILLSGADAETIRLLKAAPHADFYAPASWLALDGGIHDAKPAAQPDRIWLLAKQSN